MTERRNDLAQTAAAGNLSAAAAASPLSGETGKTGETALSLRENVEKFGEYLLNMGKMMTRIQRRMEELEAAQRAATVSHREALRLRAMIRARGDAYCEQYGLRSAESMRAVRAAIKRDLRRRFGIYDAHDLPAAQLHTAEEEITRWTSVRLAMECRDREGGETE